MQNDADMTDMVYTNGYALLALQEAYRANRNGVYRDAYESLATFLAGVQCWGESGQWDGSWRGSYSLKRITREQYHRVRLPGPPPAYAVCANGGHLLADGESDPDWQAEVRRRLSDCAPLAEIREHLRRTADEAWLLKERVAEDLFAYLVVDRTALPDTYVKDLAAWAGPRGWTVSLQGRKIYAVPRPLTKSAAVAEVARRTGAAPVFAAGDSLLDADLLLAADAGWRPGHGELADSGWTAPQVTALRERGVVAGERILTEALRLTSGPAHVS